jgi:DNA-binding NarL/FixJ family response regulator
VTETRSNESHAGEAAWIVVRGSAGDVPEPWASRCIEMVMVPLMPGETKSLLARERAEPELQAEDLPLAQLVARGVPARRIASELAISSRSVERRLQRLRHRLGVSSTAELAVLLARRGF